MMTSTSEGERRKEMREALDAAYAVTHVNAEELFVDVVRRLLSADDAQRAEAKKWLMERKN